MTIHETSEKLEDSCVDSCGEAVRAADPSGWRGCERSASSDFPRFYVEWGQMDLLLLACRPPYGCDHLGCPKTTENEVEEGLTSDQC